MSYTIMKKVSFKLKNKSTTNNKFDLNFSNMLGLDLTKFNQELYYLEKLFSAVAHIDTFIFLENATK
jgi:hypothetical protein